MTVGINRRPPMPRDPVFAFLLFRVKGFHDDIPISHRTRNGFINPANDARARFQLQFQHVGFAGACLEWRGVTKPSGTLVRHTDQSNEAMTRSDATTFNHARLNVAPEICIRTPQIQYLRVKIGPDEFMSPDVTAQTKDRAADQHYRVWS